MATNTSYDFQVVTIAESSQGDKAASLVQALNHLGRQGYHFAAIFKLPGVGNEYMLLERKTEKVVP